MNGLLLNSLNAKLLQLLVEHLAQIHDHGLVNLLPQVGTEDLDQRNLQSGDLAVQENASQVELNLETDVDIGTVDSGRPPQSETTVRDLVQTGSLGVGEFLEFHAL
jgi:hypothetical protein